MQNPEEDGLSRMIHEAGDSYRAAPEPRIEAMWQQIETRAFAPRPRISWNVPLALAAVLALGLGVGFWAGRRAAAPEPAGSVVAPNAGARLAMNNGTPFVGVASNYLEQMTSLVISVASDLRTGQVPSGTIGNARELLSTTRLLLDSGVEDPRFRDLLEDLELVLAQVVRLRDATPSLDAALIAQALDQREVLPRLTSYLNATVAQ